MNSILLKLLEQLDINSGDKILILGGYGVRNVGDEAILAGLLSILPENLQIKVISLSPEETKLLHGVDAISPLKSIMTLGWADVLIIGGGGLFSGHMGPYQRLIPLYGLLAAIMGVKVAIISVGVYPSTPNWVIRAFKWLASKSIVASVRDNISLMTLQSLGIDAILVPDLSELASSDSPEVGRSLLRSLGVEEDRPVVGLALTSVKRTLTEQILQEIPRVIEALPDTQFIFIPMSQHPKNIHHNDLYLGKRLKKLVPRLLILEKSIKPSAVLSLYGQLHAVIGMRYHSMIFATRMGTPLVPIPYDEKCIDFLNSHEIQPVKIMAEEIISRLRETGART